MKLKNKKLQNNLSYEFDAAYYINLDYRSDRRAKFESKTKYLGIEKILRIKAIEGIDVDLLNWPGTAGELGIRESHIYTLEHAQRNKFNKFIIFEDDAIIPKNFKMVFSNFLRMVPTNWDMLYLYAENHYLAPEDIGNNILKLKNTLGLVAIVYNSKSLERIIFKLKNDLRWVDSVMADLHNELNVYAPRKSIVKHSFGYSDNIGKYIDYKNRRLTRYLAKALNFINGK